MFNTTEYYDKNRNLVSGICKFSAQQKFNALDIFRILHRNFGDAFATNSALMSVYTTDIYDLTFAFLETWRQRGKKLIALRFTEGRVDVTDIFNRALLFRGLQVLFHARPSTFNRSRRFHVRPLVMSASVFDLSNGVSANFKGTPRGGAV